tara:strand:- start:113 stop:328 length:216 start_codon:yes stop_codon:yes gene_type:complete
MQLFFQYEFVSVFGVLVVCLIENRFNDEATASGFLKRVFWEGGIYVVRGPGSGVFDLNRQPFGFPFLESAY